MLGGGVAGLHDEGGWFDGDGFEAGRGGARGTRIDGPDNDLPDGVIAERARTKWWGEAWGVIDRWQADGAAHSRFRL